MKVLHDPGFILPICIGLFWAIIFLQSGLDKVFDFKGNLSWLKGHFEKSFLGGLVSPMLIMLTLFELLAGVLSVVGIISFISSGSVFWLTQGVIVSLLSLVMLIFGQRIAKDYDGAKTIAIYFGIALLSAWILFKI